MNENRIEEEGGFHDYTIATALEKLIASIENALRTVLLRDLPLGTSSPSKPPPSVSLQLPATFTARLPHRLPFRSENYTLTLHLPASLNQHPSANPISWPLGDQPHKLQEWFLANTPCLVLAPDSYSGRVLSAEEATTLLSAGAAALSHLKRSWPLFVPVHDALRDAYRGIAFSLPAGAVLRLESDSIHGRSLPREFLQVSHQLSSFATRLRCHAPAAAAVCAGLAAAAVDIGTAAVGGGAERAPQLIVDQSLAAAAEALSLQTSSTTTAKSTTTTTTTDGDGEFDVRWAVRRSYTLPAQLSGNSLDNYYKNSREASRSQSSSSTDQFTSSQQRRLNNSSKDTKRDKDDFFVIVIETWDEEAVWRPWAAEDDVIGCLEVDALWEYHLLQDGNYNHNNNHHTTATALALSASGGGGDTTTTHSTSLPSLRSATAWKIAALRRDYTPDDGRRPMILLQAADQQRQFLRLQNIVDVPEEALLELQPPRDALPGATSFSAMLTGMVDALGVIGAAADGSELTTDGWWLQRGDYVPQVPPSYVLQDVIRDIFLAPVMPMWPGTGILGEQVLANDLAVDNASSSRKNVGGVVTEKEGEKEEVPVGKGAPLASLSSRLALHALRLGNPRAVAMLWSRFLRELRFSHWEVGVPLPRMKMMMGQAHEGDDDDDDDDDDEARKESTQIDTRHCLLHQKLELLNLCITAQVEQPRVAAAAQRTHSSGGISSSDASYLSAENGGGGGGGGEGNESDGIDDDDDWSWSAWADDVTAALEQGQDGDDGDSSSTTKSTTTAKFVDTTHQQNSSQILSQQQNGAGFSIDETVSDSAAAATAAEGVIRQLDIFLISCPDRKINVPKTQSPPPTTEDSLIRELSENNDDNNNNNNNNSGGGGGATSEAAWARTPAGALLFSDMKAFKAANPGCQFEDFVRWHSPADWVQHTTTTATTTKQWSLSPRMANLQGTWSRLWSAATPEAASQQRPLFQAALEGERVLHFLETLPPAAVHGELLAVGFAAAVALLQRAPSAELLPSVAAQLKRVNEIGQAWLGPDGVAPLEENPSLYHNHTTTTAESTTTTTEQQHEEETPLSSSSSTETEGATTTTTTTHAAAAAAAAAVLSPNPAVRAMLHSGLSMRRMKALVQLLGCVEQTVVAGQSLLQRLSVSAPSPPSLLSGSNDDVNNTISSSSGGGGGAAAAAAAAGREMTERLADGLVAAALQQHGRGYVHGADGGSDRENTGAAPSHFGAVVDVRRADIDVVLESIGDDDDDDDSNGNDDWASQPFWTEYCIDICQTDIHENDEIKKAGPASSSSSSSPPLLHRYFVRLLPAELRVATVITSEM